MTIKKNELIVKKLKIIFNFFASGFGIGQRGSRQTEKLCQRHQQNWKQ
jgi:hypothetical protein